MRIGEETMHFNMLIDFIAAAASTNKDNDDTMCYVC